MEGEGKERRGKGRKGRERGRSCIFREKEGGGRKIHLTWWKGKVGSGWDLSLKGTGYPTERPGHQITN